MAIRVREFAKKLDHTLLEPDATEGDIRRLCREAVHHHFAAVCVLPCHVRLAWRELGGTDVKVATVISFPFGADTTMAKKVAVQEAVLDGACELDVVMNISKFLSDDRGYVQQELSRLREEAETTVFNHDFGAVLLKVIIETAYLSDDEKRWAVEIVAESGAKFVKTSTGFAPGGATVQDVRLLKEEAPAGLLVKASGGIKTFADARAMLDAGASRIGTSGSVAIIREAEGLGGLQG